MNLINVLKLKGMLYKYFKFVLKKLPVNEKESEIKSNNTIKDDKMTQCQDL